MVGFFGFFVCLVVFFSLFSGFCLFDFCLIFRSLLLLQQSSFITDYVVQIAPVLHDCSCLSHARHLSCSHFRRDYLVWLPCLC